MKIIGEWSDTEGKLEGKAVGLATTKDHVVIEVSAGERVVFIHASPEELQQAIDFCRNKGIDHGHCQCNSDLADAFFANPANWE